MGKTHSKPLAARHGRGTAWARHAVCESALKVTEPYNVCIIFFHNNRVRHDVSPSTPSATCVQINYAY
jgi:hypothetical protein